MSDRWTDRLSDYLDGELGVAEREALEAHLRECGECAGTLDRLRQVVTRAAALEDRAPAADLWSGIARRIGGAASTVGATDLEARRVPRRGRLSERRLSFSLPQLAAAGIALMILSAGTAWLAGRAEGPVETAARGPMSVTAGWMADVPVSTFADAKYDAAIAELERVVDGSRDRLDTATVRIIEENLMTIDRAIAQARRALAHDPASSYLNEYLAGTMQQKLEFLRHAASMVGATS